MAPASRKTRRAFPENVTVEELKMGAPDGQGVKPGVGEFWRVPGSWRMQVCIYTVLRKNRLLGRVYQPIPERLCSHLDSDVGKHA